MVLCSLSLSFLHSTSQASTFLPRSSQLFSGIRPKGPTGIVSICFSSYSIPVPPCFFYSLFDIFIRRSPVWLFFTVFTRFPILQRTYISFIAPYTRSVNRISGRLRQDFPFFSAPPARFYYPLRINPLRTRRRSSPINGMILYRLMILDVTRSVNAS